MPAATETATYAYTAFKTEVARFPDQRVKSQMKSVSINVPELSEVTDFGNDDGLVSRRQASTVQRVFAVEGSPALRRIAE